LGWIVSDLGLEDWGVSLSASHLGAPGAVVMGYGIGVGPVYWLAERVAAF